MSYTQRSPLHSIIRLVQPSIGVTSVSTTEVVLGSITLQGKLLTSGGTLELTGVSSMISSANIKSMRVRAGGLTGQVLLSLGGITTNGFWGFDLVMHANASQASQFSYGHSHRTQDGLSLRSTPVTTTVDLTVDQPLALTAQMTSGGPENMALLSMFAKIYR